MSVQGPEANRPPSNALVADLPPDILERLVALRRRFEESQDRFTARELAHLRFVRWLYETRRLTA